MQTPEGNSTASSPLGLSFMPTLQFHFGIIPIVFGAYFGLIGALEREKEKS